MKFGFIPIEGGPYYREFLDEITLGESLGFDSVWLEEHHGLKNHYWPSPLIALAGIATQTERLIFGTDVLIMPFYHPVRVVEDAAMLHIMSHGRFILGAAIGYRPDEFTLYQVPMEKRGARFEEAIRLIRQLWIQEEVNFEGTYYRVSNLKIEPRPERQPGPPIWMGGWGNRALARAATLGDAWLPGPTADLGKLLAARQYYRETLVAVGIDPATKSVPLTREVVIAENDEKAREMAEKHLLISYRDEYSSEKWKHPLISAENVPAADPLDTLGRDRFLVGSPETVIEQIKRFQNAFGVDHLICRLYFPGMPHDFIMREIQLLAKEIIPVFS